MAKAGDDKKSGKKGRGGFKPRYGTHVFGDEFWPGAKPDPDELVERLIEGSSVAIFGLRRIGKSSLIAETRERLVARGHNALWIDLQKHNSLAGALAAILKALADNTGMVARIASWTDQTNTLPAPIKAKIKSIISKKLDALSDGGVDDYAEALFDQIGLELAQLEPVERPIVIFDELPFLIVNAVKEVAPEDQPKAVARLNRFLAILRHWRSVDVGVAMAICGSFSMAWLRREYGVEDGHLNDCEPIPIEEMERDEARKFVDACVAVSAPAGWADASADALLDILPAYYPGVIQLAHSKIRHAHDASPKALKGKLRDLIEDALADTYYVQFDRRFRRYDRSERDRAARLFTRLATAKKTGFEEAVSLLASNPDSGDEQDGRDLLDLLQSDGFVIASRRRGVRYSSGLVSSWRSD